jgi:hypothetical protein
VTPGVPPLRIRTVNGAPVREPARWVLYWMTAARRASANFALERAADWARRLGLPLVVLEALRCDYPWAPERPIFGTIRYMSSANTARKLPVRSYLERYA